MTKLLRWLAFCGDEVRCVSASWDPGFSLSNGWTGAAFNSHSWEIISFDGSLTLGIVLLKAVDGNAMVGRVCDLMAGFFCS
ncbi:hypothetical protein [Pseudomonas fluorescens]|uniref:hypothetical protein n=1 Tax=Pseudomonas fluorescens TaxID=294 RepID=UPI001240BC44|nr:hypothetical protein [Pseudomonas fluorescens]